MISPIFLLSRPPGYINRVHAYVPKSETLEFAALATQESKGISIAHNPSLAAMAPPCKGTFAGCTLWRCWLAWTRVVKVRIP